MGILTWIIFGLLAGITAKFLMPGKDSSGFVITILLGIAGAIVGGFVGQLLGLGDVAGFDLRGFLLAVGGALLLLACYRFIKKR